MTTPRWPTWREETACRCGQAHWRPVGSGGQFREWRTRLVPRDDLALAAVHRQFAATPGGATQQDRRPRRLYGIAPASAWTEGLEPHPAHALDRLAQQAARIRDEQRQAQDARPQSPVRDHVLAIRRGSERHAERGIAMLERKRRTAAPSAPARCSATPRKALTGTLMAMGMPRTARRSTTRSR